MTLAAADHAAASGLRQMPLGTHRVEQQKVHPELSGVLIEGLDDFRARNSAARLCLAEIRVATGYTAKPEAASSRPNLAVLSPKFGLQELCGP